MKIKGIEEKAFEALTEQSTEIEIDIQSKLNFLERILVKLRLKQQKNKLKITLNSLPLGVILRISSELSGINIKEIEEIGYIRFINNHFETALNVLVLAIQSNDKPIDKHLKEVVKWSLTPKEMFQIFLLIVQKMDVTAFTSSIVLTLQMGMKSQTSQMTEGIIASGDTSVAS